MGEFVLALDKGQPTWVHLLPLIPERNALKPLQILRAPTAAVIEALFEGRLSFRQICSVEVRGSGRGQEASAVGDQFSGEPLLPGFCGIRPGMWCEVWIQDFHPDLNT